MTPPCGCTEYMTCPTCIASLPSGFMVRAATIVRLPVELPSRSGPEHYSSLSPEPIDVIKAWGLNFNRGAVVKYIARAGKKSGNSELDDLRKARDYIDHEIAHLRAQEQR